jgi:hypothetical protein
VSRLRITLLFGALVALAALLPAAADAGTITKQTEVGKVTIEGGGFSVTPSASSSRPQAHAAGSSLGRIGKCKPKRRARQRIPCWIKHIIAVDEVVYAFLEGVVTGNGGRACPLLIEAERIRLGGAACPQRLEGAASELAPREPEVTYMEGSGLGRRATALAVLLLDHPRDAVLVELAVTPRRYWRITDVSDLFP